MEDVSFAAVVYAFLMVERSQTLYESNLDKIIGDDKRRLMFRFYALQLKSRKLES